VETAPSHEKGFGDDLLSRISADSPACELLNSGLVFMEQKSETSSVSVIVPWSSRHFGHGGMLGLVVALHLPCIRPVARMYYTFLNIRGRPPFNFPCGLV